MSILGDADWKLFWDNNVDDPENLWEIIKNIIIKCADNHCPMKQMKIRDDSPTWFSGELIEELYHKDDLYNLATRFGTQENWEYFRI